MGDLPRPMIPLSPPVKAGVDVTVVGSSILGYFQAIPWSSIAAAVAAFYTVLLIIGWFMDRLKKRQ